MMEIAALRSSKERPLFVIAAVFSVLIWAALIIGTLGVGLIYVLIGVVVYLIMHALFLAAIKGNGVRITADQFPELHSRVAKACERLGLGEPPEAYLLNLPRAFNAFATRYIGRKFIVLFAELLEHCDEESGAVDFIISHEIGHHVLGHLRYNAFLLPARFVPLLGPAYSRACEYSCDQVGLAVVERPEAAIAGLAVLAAGGRYAKRLNIEALMKQRRETGKFWMAVHELCLSHPYLSKRIGAVYQRLNPAAVPAVGRNPFSYLLAPFFGFAGTSSGRGSVLMVVLIIGILAAIAIPSFMKYKERASATQATLEEHDREAESPEFTDPELEAILKQLQQGAATRVEVEDEGGEEVREERSQ